MINKVNDFIKNYNVITAGSEVVVGVSGGADSMCLLFLLKRLREEKGSFTLKAIHVHHGIRPITADRDAEFVKAYCDKWQISLEIEYFDVPAIARDRHMSVEEAGRILRYEAFEKALSNKDKGIIAVAHHRNDQAETVLHNLLRGTGLQGLSGMEAVSEYAMTASNRSLEDKNRQSAAIRIIRPLLGFSRKEIEAILQEFNIEYVHDETNDSLDYTRNKIRKVLLKDAEGINEKAVEHIAQAAERIRQAQAYIEENARREYERYIVREGGRLMLSCAIADMPPILASEIVRLAINEMAGRLKDITAEHVNMVLQLMRLGSGKSVQLPYEITITRNYNLLVFERSENTSSNDKAAELHVRIFDNSQGITDYPKENYTKWLDYDKINSCVQLRNPESGDFIRIKGGTQKLQDFFTRQKVPKYLRQSAIVISAENSKEILWVVAGNVSRINEYYKVSDSTKHIIELLLI